MKHIFLLALFLPLLFTSCRKVPKLYDVRHEVHSNKEGFNVDCRTPDYSGVYEYVEDSMWALYQVSYEGGMRLGLNISSMHTGLVMTLRIIVDDEIKVEKTFTGDSLECGISYLLPE